jgi:hypothetical protein
MSDVAPWEAGGESGKQAPQPGAPGTGAYKLPARLPEIYKPQTQAFIAPAGNTVPQPQPTPRPLEPKGKTAVIALIVAAVVGLAWAGLVFVLFSAETPTALRMIYAGIGIVVAAVSVIVLLAEYPRIQAYRFGNFVPGVLVYGSRATIEKVVGSAGIGSIQLKTIRGTGSGVLSKVFDRSTHKTAPPELVGLHVNLGNGPEIIGIEWTAVHEFQRGEIVWFQPKGATSYLMFHKLVPYAPWVAADKETKKHIFTELRVGGIEKQDRADKQAMGTTKVLNTDESGNIIAGDAAQKQQPQQGQRDDGKTAMLGLSEQGGSLGGADQYNQQDEYGVDPNLQQPGQGQDFKLSDPNKGFGHYGEQDQSGDS